MYQWFSRHRMLYSEGQWFLRKEKVSFKIAQLPVLSSQVVVQEEGRQMNCGKTSRLKKWC